jgi:hypothetical protein
MFSRLARYAEDDGFVKLVFEHVQNLGVIFLVLGSAAWKQRHLGEGSAGPTTIALDVLVTFVLAIVGLCLLWLNCTHFFHRVRGHRFSGPLKFAVGLLYGVIFASLLRYATEGKA